CFFFQAEDGIRDFHVTGVQTCALPIFTNNLLLKAGEVVLAGTGVKAAIPEGYVGLVVIRSGISLTGIELVNGIGVIDSDYRGEKIGRASVGKVGRCLR